MNVIFPRMMAFSATLLLFSGQAFAGVVIDIIAEGAFDVRKVVGTFVLVAGLAVNALLTRGLNDVHSTGEVFGSGLRP